MNPSAASKLKVELEPRFFLLARDKKGRRRPEAPGLPEHDDASADNQLQSRNAKAGNPPTKRGLTFQLQTAEPTISKPSNSIFKTANLGGLEEENYMLYQDKQYVKGELRKKGELTWVPQFKKTVRVTKNRGEDTAINLAGPKKRPVDLLRAKALQSIPLQSILKKAITRGSSIYSIEERESKIDPPRLPSMEHDGGSGSGGSTYRNKQKGSSRNNSQQKLSSKGTKLELGRGLSQASGTSFSFRRPKSQQAQDSSLSRLGSSFRRITQMKMDQSRGSTNQYMDSPTRTEGRETAVFWQSPRNMSPLNLQDVTKITEQLEELDTPGLKKPSRFNKLNNPAPEEKQLLPDEFSSQSSEKKDSGRDWQILSNKNAFNSDRTVNIKPYPEFQDLPSKGLMAVKSQIELPNSSAVKSERKEGKFSIALKAVSDRSRNSIQNLPDDRSKLGVQIKSRQSPMHSSISQRQFSNSPSMAKEGSKKKFSADLSKSSSLDSIPNSLKGIPNMRIEMLTPMNKPKTPVRVSQQTKQQMKPELVESKLLSPTKSYGKLSNDLGPKPLVSPLLLKHYPPASQDRFSETSSMASKSHAPPKQTDMKMSAFGRRGVPLETLLEPKLESSEKFQPGGRVLIKTKTRNSVIPRKPSRIQNKLRDSSQKSSRKSEVSIHKDVYYPEEQLDLSDPMKAIRELAERERRAPDKLSLIFKKLPQPGYKLAAGAKMAVMPNDSESSSSKSVDDNRINKLLSSIEAKERRRGGFLKQNPASFLVESQPFNLMKLALFNVNRLETGDMTTRRGMKRKPNYSPARPGENSKEVSLEEMMRRKYVEASRPPDLVDPMEAYTRDVQYAMRSGNNRLLSTNFFKKMPASRD